MHCLPRQMQYIFTLASQTESPMNMYLTTSPQKLRECSTGMVKTETTISPPPKKKKKKGGGVGQRSFSSGVSCGAGSSKNGPLHTGHHGQNADQHLILKLTEMC